MKLGRCSFLTAAAYAPVAGLLAADPPARPVTQASVPDDPAAPREQVGSAPPSSPFDALLTFTRNDLALGVKPFSLAQVRLLPSVFLNAQEATRALLRRYDADRLLHAFRINARMPSSALPLGGWEKPDVELRGHFVVPVGLCAYVCVDG